MIKLPKSVSVAMLLILGLVKPLAAARPGAFNNDLLTIYMGAIGILLLIVGVHHFYKKNKAAITKALGLNRKTS